MNRGAAYKPSSSLLSPGSNQNFTQQAWGSADRVFGASSVSKPFFSFLSTLAW